MKVVVVDVTILLIVLERNWMNVYVCMQRRMLCWNVVEVEVGLRERYFIVTREYF